MHRDLKPGNIMLTQGGAKLMDFGLGETAGHCRMRTGIGVGAASFTAAATMSGPSPLSPLTTAGSIIGTIQYMSPEQIEGKEADARSDIFAFGAVLYEMAAGKRPFEGQESNLAGIVDSGERSRADQRDQAEYSAGIRTCCYDLPAEKSGRAFSDRRTTSSSNCSGSRRTARSRRAAAHRRPRSSRQSERLGWAAAVDRGNCSWARRWNFLFIPVQPAQHHPHCH